MKHTNQHQRLHKAWKTLELPLATPAHWKTADLNYFIPMYSSSEGCANILGSGIRISFRQKMLYLIVIYKNKGHL